MLGYGPIAAQPIGAEAIVVNTPVIPTLNINCSFGRLNLVGKPATITFSGNVLPGPGDIYTIQVGQTGEFALNYTPKRPADIELFGVDFSKLLAARGVGVTITGAHWVNTTAFGIDPDPNAMFLGPAIVDGTYVVTWMGGGLTECGYYPVCYATLSTHEIVSLPDIGNGLLEILP